MPTLVPPIRTKRHNADHQVPFPGTSRLRRNFAVSSPELVMQALRSGLRRAGVTYRQLAERIGMSESSIKRVFSQGDMSLTRLAAVCKAAGLSMEDVLREAADAAPHADVLTLAQERSLMADPELLLVAICCLGHWSAEQIVETYAIDDAACVKALVRLDRLGLIELRPLNRYRLRVSRTFRWQADGPVQQFFREAMVPDYYAGRFDGSGETLLSVHGRLSVASAQELVQRVHQLGGELTRLHQEDQRLRPQDRDGYTLMVGLRSWEFAAFTTMRRAAAVHQKGPRNR
jgi:transcriptional regulator with XRE-family HTH domain